jgi:hypothetical protein
MMNKFFSLKIILGVLTLVFWCHWGASAQTVDCTKTTDADLVKAIMEKIAAKYPDLTQQVNVHVEKGVVYLEGWVANKDARKDIEKIAKNTSCVKKVKSKLKKATGGGCGAGQKQCGEICIPSNQTCNISKSN